MEREKTNSITHLVKVVAREEIENYMLTHKINLDHLEDLTTQLLSDVISTCEKTGAKWERDEDALLIQEVRAAIAQIAKNHSRSIHAIKCRIDQKGLLNS